MAAIKGKDTKPEMLVRRMLHGMGFRYSLHRKGLPGRPDIVLTRHGKIVLVNGCFWHMHSCRYGQVKLRNNAEFWENKRQTNRERDRRNRRDLKALGWKVLTVWECQTRDPRKLERILRKFMDS